MLPMSLPLKFRFPPFSIHSQMKHSNPTIDLSMKPLNFRRTLRQKSFRHSELEWRSKAVKEQNHFFELQLRI
jgi:hypothetical protein